MKPETDVLIVGAGLAGLYLALRLAPRRCTIVCPAPPGEAASSAWAQGGLAAALAPDDSPEAHAKDTVLAGDGLVDPLVAHLVAKDGQARVMDLLELGVPFDRTPEGALALSLEAAHSQPRVARVAGDLAGKAIMEALSAAIHSADHVTVNSGYLANRLLQNSEGHVTGVELRDLAGSLSQVQANETVFCTGGSGGLFRVTTNPKAARGDALAMAYEAGALLSDLEFIQFHPTAIDISRDPAPLATEALRGEGAVLVNRDGSPFMHRYDADGDLAPRDRVARAVHEEARSERGAFLDVREALGERIAHHFPTVFGSCQSAGIDPRRDLIPVAPAAHYHMGGIVTDIWGRTTLEGLSACGECASTGIHGANRLASNSLLEAVVFAARIADRLRDNDTPQKSEGTPVGSNVALSDGSWRTLRTQMADHCGVVRHKAGLDALLSWLETQKENGGQPQSLLVAELIALSAATRLESRGGHYRSDHPASGTGPPQRSFIQKTPSGPHIFHFPALDAQAKDTA